MSSETATARVATIAVSDVKSLSERRRTADRIFRRALAFSAALTLFWGYMLISRREALGMLVL